MRKLSGPIVLTTVLAAPASADPERRVRMEPDGLVFVSQRVSTVEFPDCPSGV